MVLLAVMVLLAAVMVSSAPPVTKKIVKATDSDKMHDIKLATTSKASSQKLQEGKQALDEEAPAEDAEAAPADDAAAEEAPAEDAAADGDAGDSADAASDDDSDDDSDEPDGVADDDEQASKMGFWKKIIGGNPGGMGMGNGDHHPSKDIPALVWALPIVGFCGVGIAIAAYCSFGT